MHYRFSSPTETTIVSVSNGTYTKVTMETHRTHSGVSMETGAMHTKPLWLNRFTEITQAEFDAGMVAALHAFEAKVGVPS